MKTPQPEHAAAEAAQRAAVYLTGHELAVVEEAQPKLGGVSSPRQLRAELNVHVLRTNAHC